MKASQVDDAIFSTHLAKKAWVPHKRTNTLLNNNKKKYMRDIEALSSPFHVGTFLAGN